MFVWGSTVHGELGVGGVEEEQIQFPQKLDWFESENVGSVALGKNHSLFLTTEGKVYSCGDNTDGQLGRGGQPRKRPHPVTALAEHCIVAVACGEKHSLALNKYGVVFAWGSNEYGQLGNQFREKIQTDPEIVQSLTKYHVVQIACGQYHSVALCNSGEILCWGANSCGELGIGRTSNHECTPVLLKSLLGIPFALICCGSNHTFALSKSGAVFGWGKNLFGQLGFSDLMNKVYPHHLKTIRSIKVRYLTCGEDYSTFLTLDGGVLSCGFGTNGQLGHGSLSNEILPKQIIELMGSTITQIACGKKHTLAFAPSGSRVYSFGVGGSGQLGLRTRTNISTPQAIIFPWQSSGTTSSVSTNKKGNYKIHRIFAGGDRSVVLVKTSSEDTNPHDCRLYNKISQIEEVDMISMEKYGKFSKSQDLDNNSIRYLKVVFRSQQCLNGSFLLSDNQHYWCASKRHGVDLALAEKCFSLIGKCDNEAIKEIVWEGIVEYVLPSLSPSPPDVESLRIYLTIPLYHEFNNPRHHMKLHKPFGIALLKLAQNASSVVGGWWRLMTPEYFEKLAIIFKSVVSFILQGQNIPRDQTIRADDSLETMLDILSFLNKLNHLGDRFLVPYDTFHLTDLSQYVDVRIDYVLWLHDSSSNGLFLCNYPFLFDATAKTQLLETDQSLQMNAAMQQAVFIQLMMLGRREVNQFLVLQVSRDKLVADTLRELDDVNPEDLKKPLKVKFYDEEAEDAGGVSKEFFMLILREIINPMYGMFKEYEETRTLWFSNIDCEERQGYQLIGMIIGLAIYNFTIISLPFPLALYKKLLDEPVVLSDLKALEPTIYNSFENMLQYTEDDFEDVFAVNFVITVKKLDQEFEIPLKPNGENIAVTQENKKEYVDLYIDYIFNKSVSDRYLEFRKGFMKVCYGRVLRLFHSHELMAVINGNENYDWYALEEVAQYKGGYTSSSETIRMFWEVLHEMSLQDKKKFLLFLTGCDRVPIQGMKEIKIIIQKTNDEKYLPVAHTCFNMLDLPEYKTKERLKYNLMQAIQHNTGFSLV